MKRLALVLALLWPMTGLADLQAAADAYKRRDYETAKRELLKLAEIGDATAQSGLGVLYSEGRGVPVDHVKAAKWFRLSAEQANVYGQGNLGHAYYSGQGVPKNYAEAMKWWRLSAMQGDNSSQRWLGVMYRDGHGVPEDFVQAYAWFIIATAQDAFQASDLKDAMRKRMNPDQLEKAQELSETLCAKIPNCAK